MARIELDDNEHLVRGKICGLLRGRDFTSAISMLREAQQTFEGEQIFHHPSPNVGNGNAVVQSLQRLYDEDGSEKPSGRFD